ncbi:hypothetical protein H5410_056205 [Solanum commersonii]|uniref:Uncharacterized protein n=1 Tax=Solanum commersonii TaxID=4109 RepID=A0A9J5WLG6_SOLCO|nr:hypothetical protein H5410_056205 [Solanum commersonii]
MKNEIVDNLRLLKVLSGRVFDPDIITKPCMRTLADAVEIQSWTHLFMTQSPVMHEEEVMELYYNVEFTECGSLNTQVRNKAFHLNEERLGEILNVPREGIRSVVGRPCTKSSTKECGKLS